MDLKMIAWWLFGHKVFIFAKVAHPLGDGIQFVGGEF